MTKLTEQTNWREDLRELGFGNQAVIVGTKRRELFDEIAKLLADERKKVLEEVEGWVVELEKLNGGEIMWTKLYPPELDGDDILLGNWLKAKLNQLKEINAIN